jgi:hypothetical protein
MKKDIDELINEALSQEDEALLENLNEEPGWMRQAFGLFRGPLAWVMWVVFIVQIAMFLGALYAGWTVFTTSDLMAAVKWGVLTVVLVQLTTFLRGFMGSHLEANRVLRELRRLDLRLIQRTQQRE